MHLRKTWVTFWFDFTNQQRNYNSVKKTITIGSFKIIFSKKSENIKYICIL